MTINEIYEILHEEPIILKGVRILILVLLGIPFALTASKIVEARFRARLSPHQGMIIGKVIRYSLLFIILLTVLKEFGFSIATLLGAAGIASVAIGFAAQTSLSNVISGVFLMGEKPFAVGDIINVNGQTGEVLSIDTLSVKIRAFDNRFIRIPNETMIKTDVINITRFPLRRIDITVGVAYKSDLRKVKSILEGVILANPKVLDHPKALLLYSTYNTSSIDILVGVWVERADFLEVKNDMIIEIKEAFDLEGIEIPFPHLSLYTGEETKPFPVQNVIPENLKPLELPEEKPVRPEEKAD